MPITNAKCTNCGATLQVDNAHDAAICPYCHSAFVVEKAIKNYNITNNIQAGVVNIYGTTNDFDIRGGVLFKYNGISMQPLIPNTVVKIGERAFADTMITSVIMPDGVLEIDKAAFINCKRLTEVKIPDSVTVLGENAFSNCVNLAHVKLPDNSATFLGSSLFSGCISLREIMIPNKIRKISARLFACSIGLRRVDISSGVEVIGANAFEKCIALQSIVLPRGLKLIEEKAFIDCANLYSVTLPDTLEHISKYAFSGCNALSRVDGICSINKEALLIAFKQCSTDNEYTYTGKYYYSSYIPYGQWILSEIWREQGKCTFCGGDLNIFRTCKNCKKKNGRFVE